MLPKFLIADNSQQSQERIYVVHTQSPRCIIETDLDDFTSNQVLHWIDPVPAKAEVESLLDLAEDFFEAELAYQEELYDTEFDD